MSFSRERKKNKNSDLIRKAQTLTPLLLLALAACSDVQNNHYSQSHNKTQPAELAIAKDIQNKINTRLLDI